MNLSKALNIRSLKNKEDIKLVLKNGQKVYTKFGLIFLQNNPGDDITKVGILMKRSSGSAVQRNYVKRIIRNFVRINIKLFSKYNRIIFLYNFDGVISYNQLREEYICALSKK